MSTPENDRSYQQYFTKGHDLLRKAVRDFVKKEMTGTAAKIREMPIILIKNGYRCVAKRSIQN